MDAQHIHNVIAKAAPIVGVTPETRTIDFAPTATDDQRTAANALMASLDFNAPTPDMVDAERDRRLKTVPFNGVVYQFIDGHGSDLNIAGASTLALAAMIAGAQPGDLRWSDPSVDFTWIAADNSQVTMDAQTMLAFGKHASAWKQTHIYKARALKNLSPVPSDFSADHRWLA